MSMNSTCNTLKSRQRSLSYFDYDSCHNQLEVNKIYGAKFFETTSIAARTSLSQTTPFLTSNSNGIPHCQGSSVAVTLIRKAFQSSHTLSLSLVIPPSSTAEEFPLISGPTCRTNVNQREESRVRNHPTNQPTNHHTPTHFFGLPFDDSTKS